MRVKEKGKNSETHPTNPLALQLPQQPLPTRVDIPRAKSTLAVKAHMTDMAEPRRTANHTLVDSSLALLLLPAGTNRRGGGDGGGDVAAGGLGGELGGVFVSEGELFEEF